MMTIRKATVNDTEILADLLLLAMEDIVYRFIGQKNPEKARAFMLHFVERKNNQYSFQNCWIAEKDGMVLGAANIYNGGHLHSLRKPVLDYVRSHYNANFYPEDETKEGEYYLDTLGVHPNHQGKGIGTRLLQFLVDEYVNRQGQTLGLLVDEENPSAKRLYVRLGFESAGVKVLLGKKLEHLQFKSGGGAKAL